MTALAATAEDPRDCWRTPRKLYDMLHERFRFDMDGAADSWNHLAAQYWNIIDDGVARLSDPINDRFRVFVNPPYRNIGPWVEACWRRSMRGGFSALLLPVRSDQIWWHEFAMRGEIRFFVGRVSFDPPPGIAASSNREPSALVIFDVPGQLNSKPQLSINHRTGWIA